MKSMGIIAKMKHILGRTIGKHYLPELFIYVAVWGIVFLFPVVNVLFATLSGRTPEVHWTGILYFWLEILPFFLLFLLNDRVLVPRLFFRQKTVAYFVSAILITVVVVGLESYLNAPDFRNQDINELPMRQLPPDGIRREAGPKPGEWHPEMKRDSGDTKARPLPPAIGGPRGPRHMDDNRPFFPEKLIPVIGGPFLVHLIIALLMLSFNIAVKLFFKSVRDREKMKEMERDNLQSELEYLKYQINPHFFMNTLNNIHALVDIDTEKAKKVIMELSKLMRYMLYETDKCTVLLIKEVHFLQHYIELMRIRYPESIRINFDLPENTNEVRVPPLLFVSFVENAFKHGVSYQKDSFISVKLEVEGDEILFNCSNSNFGKCEDQYHGIGLENIRKRLQLLFGDRYTLSINETETSFDVLLVMPINLKTNN